MTPDKIERVFGHGRLKMVTGEHVEVFREAVEPGERRRYTKRFLATGDADFRQWTQREWRILARLIGHGVRCVPDVVQFDGGMTGGMRQVQTYDAGITVDQWATLLPVARDGAIRRHIFEDCAHWWALAHHCLGALEEIHRLQLVHLDIKADNICIPCDPAGFDPMTPGARLYPAFSRLALIDFAFSLISREPLATPLPLGWQKDYDYQSPRLLRALEAGAAGELRPTQELDWRCDLYSLAAMLRRYLPDDEWARSHGQALGWGSRRYDAARSLIYRLRDCHDRDLPAESPHAELMQITAEQLTADDLAASLASGWLLAHADASTTVPMLATPMTRIAAPRAAATPALSVPLTAITEVPAVFRNTRVRVLDATTQVLAHVQPLRRRWTLVHSALAAALGIVVVGASVLLAYPEQYDRLTGMAAAMLDRSQAMPQREHAEQHVAATTDAAPAAIQPASTADVDPPQAAREQQAVPEPTAANHAMEEEAPTVAASEALSDETPPRAEATNAPTEPASAQAEVNRAPAERLKANADTATPASEPASASVARVSGRAAPRSPKHAAKLATGPQQHRATANAPTSARPSPPMTAHSRIVSAARVAPAPTPVKSTAAANVDLAAAAKATQALVNASTANAQPPSRPNVELAAAPPMPMPKDVARPAASVNADANASTESAPASTAPATITGDTRPPATARTEPRRARAAPAPMDPWRAALRDMLTALGVHEQPPAPVEERNVTASPNASAASRAPRPPVATIIAPAQKHALEPMRATSPNVITAPLDATERIADAAPRATQAVATRSRAPSDDNSDLLLYQGKRMLSVDLPRIAAQAQNDIGNVLWAAAGAEYASQDRAVRSAATGSWPSERAQLIASATSVRGHYLHADARQAFALGRDAEALDLALRAFAANPRDPEIAGFLALLHLRVKPMQPEVARQLALYSLASSGSSRTARVDDWNTFAVASALSGHDSDATRALLAEVALTTDLDRSCRAALGAYNMYGERLRGPVQAMIYRVHAQGRDRESTSCRWGGTRPVRYAGADSSRF